MLDILTLCICGENPWYNRDSSSYGNVIKVIVWITYLIHFMVSVPKAVP